MGCGEEYLRFGYSLSVTPSVQQVIGARPGVKPQDLNLVFSLIEEVV